MARRKLSQHQQKRIQGAQDTASAKTSGRTEGLVISHHGGKIIVETPDMQLIKCAVKSNLGSIVCGDRVVIEQTAVGEYRVLAIRPRQNFLQRVDGFGQLKSVAANITQLLICLSVKPEPNLFLLDQYLLSAEQNHLEPVIILNKVDLLENNEEDPFSLRTIYQSLGYKVVHISVTSGEGLDQLKSLFDHHYSVLSGVSGVGKSSITKALLPDIEIKIGIISAANEEGKHTTRTSRLYHLENDGHLIDTPGVRGFNPKLDTSIPVSAGFREIQRIGVDCRFSNCRHINEPKCAVLEALKRDEIATTRYQHYLRLVDSLSTSH